jgi:hypothetical protein
MILGQKSSILKMQCHVDPAVYVYTLLGTSVFLYVMSGHMMNLYNFDTNIKLSRALGWCEELRQRVIELEDLIEINDTEDKAKTQE